MRYWAFLILSVLLIGCAKTAPQRPSQRSGQAPRVDSSLLAMISVNERLVEEADKEVLAWIQAHPEQHFNQMDGGAWRIQRTPEVSARAQQATNPQPKEQWHISYQIYHLDGTLAEDHDGTFTIGRGELAPAVDEAVQQMIASEQTILIVPWYCAFGMKGTEQVKPYENVRIDLRIGDGRF